MRIKTINDLANSNLPTFAIMDIYNRIRDWQSSGGRINDDYIQQQFRYAEMVSNCIDNPHKQP